MFFFSPLYADDLHLSDEQTISEIYSLVNFYFEKKLDSAISKVEGERNYNAAIYEQWLNG